MTKHICNKEKVFTKIFLGQELIQSDLKQIKKYIEGNGRPGLIQKSEEAHDFIIQMKERQKSMDMIEKWSRKKLLFWGGLVATVFFILIQFIVNLILEYLKARFGII